MSYMSSAEYNLARILIKVLGLRTGLQVYNLFAIDQERVSTGPTLIPQQIHLPPAYDLSHWKTVTDWYNILPHPILMGTKATQGTSYKDPTFPEYFTNFKVKVGCRRLAYHYFEKTLDPVKQANWFLDYITPYLMDDDVLALDFEQGGEIASQLWAFSDRVSQRRPKNLQMFYSRKNLADQIFMTPSQKEYFKNKPFWTAGYPPYPEKYTTTPLIYTPDQTKWGHPWLWQYTDQGPVSGIQNGVDTNLVEQSFIDWLGGYTPPPLPPPGGTMKKGQVVSNTLNIRAKPDDINNVTNPPIGFLKVNDIVTSEEQTPTNWWKLTSIIRDNVGIVLPGPDCWASAGTNTIYIKEITIDPVEPTPPDKVTVVDGNVTWESTTFRRVP